MQPVICDFLKVTFPKEYGPEFLDSLALFLTSHFVTMLSEGYYSFENGGGIRTGYYGQVCTLSVSGSVIEHLRSKDDYGQFLAMISDYPHRVTMIDAAYDVYDLDTGSVLRRIYSQASKGKHSLTRKALDPDRHLKKLFSPGRDGKDTGTVYLGRRGKSEVYCRVYDKRKERIDNGHPDPDRNIIRYELSVTGKMCPTLKDAFDPTRLFWHYMGRTLLQCPKGLSDWTGHSEGYELPARLPLDPYQALLRKIEHSQELRELARIAALSGPVGCRRLKNEIDSICRDALTISDLKSSRNVVSLVKSSD